jgi:hypothetical protein
MAPRYPTSQSRLVDVSAEFFDGSFFNVGTISIAPFVAGEELDLSGTVARLEVGGLFTHDSDAVEALGILEYDFEEQTLGIKITPALNALLDFGRNDVAIWIVFNPGAPEEEPEELARGVWQKNKRPASS